MRKLPVIQFLLVSSALLFACKQQAQDSNAMQSQKPAAADKLNYTIRAPYDVETLVAGKSKKVKNVILMIGDGMGMTQVSTAWVANKGKLYFDNFRYIGFSRTTAANKLITDSGASATAMATGKKTKYHAVGVDTLGNDLPTLTDLARAKGLATGLVVSCSLTDATPASFAANNIDREEEEELATDFLHSEVDVLFGGGRHFFNNRKDNRNLLKEMEQKGYQVMTSAADFMATNKRKVMAVVEDGQIAVAPRRGDVFQNAAIKALDLLNNKNGFFAMLEGSRIDDMGHGNNLPGVMEEVMDFDKTIGKVLKWAQEDGETLVIVTADHETGGFTLLDGNKETGTVSGQFSTGGHSGVWVPVYAWGPQAELFTGMYENTEIFTKIAALLNLQ